jgi:Tfp pilus assembly protein PilX
MRGAKKAPGIHTARAARGAPGSVLIITLMAVTVLATLGFTILTISFSEDFNARREGDCVRAFFAAEAGVHEALARLNMSAAGANNDEIEVVWTAGTGNPDAVRDPRMLQGNSPEPNPANYSDSSINSWRFWNYDPTWRYSGTGSTGDGNYPGATALQQANLNSAGRAFAYDGASVRTLRDGSSYAVRVVPHIRNLAGIWQFVDQGGGAAAANTYYYRISATGSHAGQTATVQVLAKKFFFAPVVPATMVAGGDVTVGGNASVTTGDPGDQNPSGVAVQSAGTASTSGSGSVTGSTSNNTPFPTFEAIFGLSRAELQAKATLTGTYTAHNTTNPAEVPSGTVGQLIWLTAMNGGAKQDITLTGSGSGGYTLGSPTQPVVLVVDGNLNLNTVTIYGVLYVTGAFRNQGGSQIRGAVLVEGTAETDILGTGSGGDAKIAYSANVMRNLDGSSNLFPFSALKGTWKMKHG